VRLATQESTYLIATAPGIPSIQHPDAPAMVVTLSWLNMLEGYMWKRIRGAGLAYGASIRADMRRGQVLFSVYRSPNGFAAWNEARKIVSEIVSGEVPPPFVLGCPLYSYFTGTPLVYFFLGVFGWG